MLGFSSVSMQFSQCFQKTSVFLSPISKHTKSIISVKIKRSSLIVRVEIQNSIFLKPKHSYVCLCEQMESTSVVVPSVTLF